MSTEYVLTKLNKTRQLVAGNLISSQALASINIFYPAMIAVTVISSVVDSGSATSLSTSMGTNDIERIRRTKSAVKRVMIVAALFVAVAQIPIIYVVISSYGLTPEMEKMCWEYAAGVMIALPLGLISSVGSYQLQIIGRMRVLMVLSIVESLSNLALDLFFVQVMPFVLKLSICVASLPHLRWQRFIRLP